MLSHLALSWPLPPALFMLCVMPYFFTALRYKSLVYCVRLSQLCRIQDNSDQGCHYISKKFREIVKDSNLRQSMSRRGNCWDNAPQESFFGHMKDHIMDLLNPLRKLRPSLMTTWTSTTITTAFGNLPN